MYNGLINVYKEPGFTSMDVIAVLRGILGQKKIGHTGTLDPAAEGVLLVCLGNATKLCDMLENHDKTYRCTMVLGRTTDTEDTTGTVTGEYPVNVTKESVTEAIKSFIGDYDQIPPMYSAVKINGRKLYELARKGETVEREPRPVVIDRMNISKNDDEWKLEATVSGGTYIRTLIHDLGASLDEYTVMTSLVRTGIETVSLSAACTLEELETKPSFVPVETVLDPSIPFVEAPDPDAVIHGRKLMLEHDAPLVLLGQQGRVLAAYAQRDDGFYHCQRGLL